MSVENRLGGNDVSYHCNNTIPLEEATISHGVTDAIKSRIPILQDLCNDRADRRNRYGALMKLMVCTVTAFILIWYMEEEAMKKPIDEGFVEVPIKMGPFPTVAVFPGLVLKADTLTEIESIFQSAPRDTAETKCQYGKFDIAEKVALANVIGQLTATSVEPNSVLAHQYAMSFLEKMKMDGLNHSGNMILSNLTIDKIACFVSQRIVSCAETLEDCETEGQGLNCSLIFKMTVTGKGFGCLFNYLHYSAMDRNQSLRLVLSEKIGKVKADKQKSADMEKVTFVERNDGSDFWSQSISGPGNGLSFTVKKTYKRQHHFDIVIGNPRDPILYRHRKLSLEFGKKHSIFLDATADFAESSIMQESFGIRRCRFYSENLKLMEYTGYTYTRCHSAYVNKRRNCRFVSDEEPAPGEKLKPLCSPALWSDRGTRETDENHRLYGFRECLRSCNDVEYSVSLHSDKLEVSENNSLSSMEETATVDIFFAKDDVTTKTKALRGITAEALGIILGMIGFCHEITLPIILDVVGIILKAIWGKVGPIFTKVRDKCRRRNNRVHNISPTWILP